MVKNPTKSYCNKSVLTTWNRAQQWDLKLCFTSNHYFHACFYQKYDLMALTIKSNKKLIGNNNLLKVLYCTCGMGWEWRKYHLKPQKVCVYTVLINGQMTALTVNCIQYYVSTHCCNKYKSLHVSTTEMRGKCHLYHYMCW